MKSLFIASSVFLVFAASGCVGVPSPDASSSAQPMSRPADAADPSGSPDASARRLRVLGLRIFQLDVPRGRVSGDADLWRRIDEQAVDPGTYDVLYANGVRVGLGPVADVDRFADLLRDPSARTLDIVGKGFGRQAQDLPVETGVFEKTLFWFDANKRPKGQTFQRCETLLNISFEPTPGDPKSIRVALVPVVRSTVPRAVFLSNGDDYSIEMRRDETLFDLKLTADVPLGQFLIVSPSEELRQESSLGRQFFTREVPGEILERVYVIVPQVVAQKEFGAGSR